MTRRGSASLRTSPDTFVAKMGSWWRSQTMEYVRSFPPAILMSHSPSCTFALCFTQIREPHHEPGASSRQALARVRSPD